MANYTTELCPDGWYALLDGGFTTIGPYVSEQECRRDVESLLRHLAAGSFGGAR